MNEGFLDLDDGDGEYQWCCSLSQPTQILARKAQLSARVVIPPVGLKLEKANIEIVIMLLCHYD